MLASDRTKRGLCETGLPNQVDQFVEARPGLACERGLRQSHRMVDAWPVAGCQARGLQG